MLIRTRVLSTRDADGTVFQPIVSFGMASVVGLIFNQSTLNIFFSQLNVIILFNQSGLIEGERERWREYGQEIERWRDGEMARIVRETQRPRDPEMVPLGHHKLQLDCLLKSSCGSVLTHPS